VKILVLFALLLAQTQDTSQHDRVMQAVRDAMAPVLQAFPASDVDGALPVANNSEAFWMVKPLQPGDTTIEVLSNPLNEVNQARANAAMKAIDRNISAAQAKAESQYERAIAEARRTGKSQDVDGISLADEGAEGEKIDADSHLTIEVLFNQPEYHFTIRGRMEPAGNLPVPLTHVDVPAHIYKEDPKAGPEHYKEAERVIFLGPVTKPQSKMREGSPLFDVTTTAGSGRTMAIRIAGNRELVSEITAKTNWNQLLELLK
jgi:hypothetical protein